MHTARFLWLIGLAPLGHITDCHCTNQRGNSQRLDNKLPKCLQDKGGKGYVQMTGDKPLGTSPQWIQRNLLTHNKIGYLDHSHPSPRCRFCSDLNISCFRLPPYLINTLISISKHVSILSFTSIWHLKFVPGVHKNVMILLALSTKNIFNLDYFFCFVSHGVGDLLLNYTPKTLTFINLTIKRSHQFCLIFVSFYY